MTMTAMLGALSLAAQQPGQTDTGAGTWWGAGVWIVITLAFLVLAFILVWKGLKEPNRR